ncbi:MAG: hypothetical protein A2W63_02025 [Deltaproteobacteria bacterium RIFCSPLOWO2_02_44_9]|nr:MAG: hypothetical protein A2W63_02025 [Deltaproteobacteria bacterium RIFCSPLOWO2_02_44_9]
MIMKGLKNLLGNKPLGVKFTLAFSLVILIPMLFIAYFSYRTIDAHLIKNAHQKIDIGLKMAWTEYYIRGDQMRYGMMQAAATNDIKKGVRLKDKKYLEKMMLQWKEKRPYVNIWTIVDKEGRVIARLNSESTGDIFDINGLIKKTIVTGEPQISTEIIKSSVLKREGEEFQRQFAVPVISSNIKDEYKRMGGMIEENAMALMVAVPVYGENYNVIGAIVTGDILNHDNDIPDTVADKMPGLITTIAMDGLRVATNLKTSKDQRATGTLLADSVMSMIKPGSSIRGEWDVLGQSYISAFDPIKNSSGMVIGSLFAGIPKSALLPIQWENLTLIAVTTAIGLASSLFIAFIFTYKITKPLNTLKTKADAFAKGDIETRIDIDGDKDTKDELKILARTFNSMMDEVKKRGEEEKRYLKELKDKNTQLGEANEKLSTAYEELEVAYEEAQSQTEELHSANEELKLLNEDLDKKNTELSEANIKIKEEEEELKKTKDKLKLIYDGIKASLLLVDHDCTVLEANKYFIENLKLADSPFIGKKLYQLFGFSKEEHTAENCPVVKSLKTKAPAEMERTTSDGKTLHWHAFPLMGEGEILQKAVLYIEDVTEHRLLLQKLTQSDKLSSLGELVSGVAHELNNPLTAAMGYSELLLNHATDEKIKKKLKDINEATQRCKRIIDNLLTFARWHKPEKKPCDINKIIKNTVELRAYQLKVDNIEVEFDLAPSLPKTMLDEHQIQQVLLNLINNAQHAITGKEEKGKITVTSRQEDKGLRIKVSDTGTGIPSDIINRIFDPFFTTKEAGKGTGLGLSISYGLIEEHSGNIYAVNKASGKGATFIIELPIIDDISQAAHPKLPFSDTHVKLSAKGLRALVLDDEPVILKLLKEALSDEGFYVDTVSHGDEALNLLKEAHYHIILSDIKIPGMNGREFYKKLKSIKPKALDNIIFMSGDTASQETRDFLRETGSTFLRKPFTIEQLKKTISKRIS